jgi:hypothetical protein
MIAENPNDNSIAFSSLQMRSIAWPMVLGSKFDRMTESVS